MGLLDLAALDAAPLVREPFDHLVVPRFLRPEVLGAVNRDYPKLDDAGNHAAETLCCGPAFQALLDELQAPAYARHIAARFGVDLEGMPATITVRGRAQTSDGNIHTDSWTKIVTTLLYFHPEWPHTGGRLRLLRSLHDLEDYAVEVEPCAGTLVAFRRTEHSFHGHRPFEGERRMLQLSWVQPTRAARVALRVKRFSTRLQKRLHLDRPNPSAPPR